MGLDIIIVDEKENEAFLHQDRINHCEELFGHKATELLESGRLGDTNDPLDFAELIGNVIENMKANSHIPGVRKYLEILDSSSRAFDMKAAEERFLEYISILNQRRENLKGKKNVIVFHPLVHEVNPDDYTKSAREWTGLLFLNDNVMGKEEAEKMLPPLEALFNMARNLEVSFDTDDRERSANYMRFLVFRLYILGEHLHHVAENGGKYTISY